MLLSWVCTVFSNINMWLMVLITILLAAVFYCSVVKPHKYWEEKGVPFEKLVNSYKNFLAIVFKMKSLEDVIQNTYNKFSKHRYMGIYEFNKPTLIIRDPELIKQITIKHFSNFSDHAFFVPKDIDPICNNLFQMSVNDGWQTMRATLSPSFTSSKMKNMFDLMLVCSNQFIEHLKNFEVPLETKDIFSRVTNDIIGSTAFGITCDSLKDKENEFYTMGKNASNFSGIRALKFLGYSFSPRLMKLLGVRIFTNKVSSFFRKTIKEAMDYRKAKHIVRPDMIHLLMETRKELEKDAGINASKQIIELTDDDITAHAMIFFVAGFESISSAITFAAYELAINPDVQQKLYQEISETVPKETKLTYDSLHSMKYLECVVSESLRLHTPVSTIDRKCMIPFTIDPVLPSETPLHLDVGTKIWVPVAAIHSDEKYFLNSKKFDPDRFNDENKTKMIPCTYIPFGSGPRICIGSRFALLEIKLLLVELLRSFEIVPNEKTKIPLRTDASVSIPEGGIWLTFKPRVTELY